MFISFALLVATNALVTRYSTTDEVHDFATKAVLSEGLVVGTRGPSLAAKNDFKAVLSGLSLSEPRLRPRLPLATLSVEGMTAPDVSVVVSSLLAMKVVDYIDIDEAEVEEEPVPQRRDRYTTRGRRANWGLEAIRADAAWSVTRGSSKVRVMVVDTRFDVRHRELRGRFWKNVVEAKGVDGEDDDDNGYIDDVFGINPASRRGLAGTPAKHGTHVAAIVAGGSWRRPIGVAPDVDLVGCIRGTRSQLADCAEYAIDKGIRVINYSAGGVGCCDPTYRRTFDVLAQHGILFVTTAGNKGMNLDVDPYQPGCFPSPIIITVAASDAHDSIPAWSGYGYRSVDIAAPGSSILSAVPNNRYETMSGTSMAAPHVSGCLALMFSANPSMTATEAKNIILDTARPSAATKFKTVSGGILDCGAAVLAAKTTTTTTDNLTHAPISPRGAARCRGQGRTLCAYCAENADCCSLLPSCSFV